MTEIENIETVEDDCPQLFTPDDDLEMHHRRHVFANTAKLIVLALLIAWLYYYLK